MDKTQFLTFLSTTFNMDKASFVNHPSLPVIRFHDIPKSEHSCLH